MIAISLCMIARDEEANLASCLDSVVGFADEIIVVDTGSTDHTKEIAYLYTDKVYDYEWNNNFSDARNFSISKASNEYILVLDCDEIIESLDKCTINQLILKNPKKVGRLIIINEYVRMGVAYKFRNRLSRLFSKKYFKYEGMIHEQVSPSYGDSTDTYHIPLTLRHTGYEGNLEVRKKKAQRNISLLKRALQKDPEDPYIIYQLGKSYYMEEDYTNASKYFGQALYYDLDTHLEYVQDMVESYGYSLLNSEQYETAMQLLNVYDEFANSADFIFLIALILMNNGKFQEAIDEFFKATKITECKMEGVNSYLAYYNAGVISECLGNIKKAKEFYIMSENYELSIERLKEMMK